MKHAIRRFVLLAVLAGILLSACESPVGSEDLPPGSEGTPLPPGSLTAAAVSAGQIALNWTDNSGDETGFKIERSVVSGTSGFSQIALVGANVTTYNDSGLAAATRYWYRVRAVNGFGDSACCSPADAVTLAASDTQAPSIPSGLSASAASSSQINLSWSASTDNVGVAGYKIYRGGSYLKSVTGTSTSDTGLSPGTAYSYQVSAYDAAGNESSKSSTVSATTPAAADTQAPSIPSGLSASAVSSSQINLSWSASTDNVGVAGYKIYRGGSYLKSVTGTSTSDTGLSPGTAYSYQVSAYDAAGNESSKSSTVSATTPAAPDTQKPTVPAGLTAAASSTSQINLSWSASTDNVGVTGYKIYRGGSYLKSVTGTSTSDTGLSPGTTYSYQVSAYDAAGNESAKSSTASAATWTVVTLYPQYDNLVMTQSNDSTVANKVYASGELAVGVNWQWNWYAGYGYMQDFLAAASLVKFDTSALAGRTIEAASLTLCVQYYGTGYFPRTWYIRALATSWSSTTVTWNVLQGLNYYTASEIAQNPPYNYSDYVINLKSTVQNWASGAYANHGLCFVQGNYQFPNMTSWDAFAFYSKEASSASLRPRLTVTYR